MGDENARTNIASKNIRVNMGYFSLIYELALRRWFQTALGRE